MDLASNCELVIDTISNGKLEEEVFQLPTPTNASEPNLDNDELRFCGRQIYVQPGKQYRYKR